jgi:hypothetical protein
MESRAAHGQKADSRKNFRDSRHLLDNALFIAHTRSFHCGTNKLFFNFILKTRDNYHEHTNKTDTSIAFAPSTPYSTHPLRAA